MERVGYAERRPYAVPRSPADLSGPESGRVTLPTTLGWTGRTEYDLDDADRVLLYERVLVEATTELDITTLLDQNLLRSCWRRLFLPSATRHAWERTLP